MEIKFNSSKGFAIYFSPSISYVDYGKEKQIRCSFLIWHLMFNWGNDE